MISQRLRSCFEFSWTAVSAGLAANDTPSPKSRPVNSVQMQNADIIVPISTEDHGMRLAIKYEHGKFA